jgi:hypothetical protein
MATEEGWLLLQHRYTTHLLACGFQHGASCCGAWLVVTTLAVQCPTCQKTYTPVIGRSSVPMFCNTIVHSDV